MNFANFHDNYVTNYPYLKLIFALWKLFHVLYMKI